MIPNMTALEEIRFRFRCHIGEALAGFRFQQTETGWTVSEPETGAIWQAKPAGNSYHFELIREMD